MNDLQQPHPSREQLSAFGLGQLEDEASAAIEDHLAGCTACRTLLEQVPGDTFVARLQESARPDESAASAPTLVKPAAPPPDAELPPELAGHPRYRLLQLLGAGGMGTVYKAEHQLMERPVALKVIRRSLTDDPAAVERFRREVKAAAKLAHPNIVAAYDAEQAGDVHFLVMEFVEGKSLEKLVAERGPLPAALACEYARQAALGLQHASERGMVHRDIKPQNLMLTPAGQVKVLDFGLARFARESVPPLTPGAAAGLASPALTQTGSVMGTPDYIAPEQAADCHAADVRADLYSLGCTLYYLLTGRVPFPEGGVLDKLLAHAERPPQPLTVLRPDLPPEVVRVVERLMAKDPARRYQTPAEAAEALRRAAEAPAEPAPAPPSRPPRRRWPTAVAVGVALAGVGGLFGLMLLLPREQEDTLDDYLTTVYTTCALLGGTLLGCQFLLGVFGLGHHHEFGGHDFHGDGGSDVHHGDGPGADHEAQTSWLVGVLTFRSVVAALTFFGLTGRAAAAADLTPPATLGLALAAGAGTLFAVAWMMRALYSLRAEGTVRIQRAVGQTGTVYLPIPGHRAGAGKVHLNLQNRTVEYQAVTAHEPVTTGTRIQVVAVVSPDTVEVIPAPTPERIPHV
jgi:serine/threonine protein kinase